jgi:hypothetical protein
MNVKDLTPEQQARQTLMLEAIREQAAYERSQRRKIAKVAKDVGKTFIALLTLTMVSALLFSCTKDYELPECVTYDLGEAGQPYQVIMDGPGGDGESGLEGKIYVEDGRIKQDVCGSDCTYVKLTIAGDKYQWICL